MVEITYGSDTYNIGNKMSKNNLKKELVSLIEDGNFNAVKEFIEAIPADNKDNVSGVPLYMAIEKGNIKLVELLINNGADIEDIDVSEGYRGTALHVAVQYGQIEVAKFLLKNGTNINASGVFGNTALDVAISSGDFKMIELLVENDANIEAINFSGKTILSMALQSYNLETVKCFLRSSQNPEVINKIVKEVLLSGNLVLLEGCLSVKDKNDEFKFKINSILDENGNRLIDLVSENLATSSIKTIKLLREHRSVEPKNPISISTVDKSIVSEGRIDYTVDFSSEDEIVNIWQQSVQSASVQLAEEYFQKIGDGAVQAEEIENATDLTMIFDEIKLQGDVGFGEGSA